ncbi:hypothetical protein MRX96_007813 [Rhipicephalus microplus]
MDAVLMKEPTRRDSMFRYSEKFHRFVYETYSGVQVPLQIFDEDRYLECFVYDTGSGNHFLVVEIGSLTSEMRFPTARQNSPVFYNTTAWNMPVSSRGTMHPAV